MPKKKILVVEDESITAEDISQRLEMLGYEVAGIAATGADAVHHAEHTPVDLTLMDIHLRGEMNGIETAEVFRREFDIPVVYLTAYTDPGTLDRIKQTEPYGLMMKPFQDSELQGVIETALYKHSMETRLKESEANYKTTSMLLESLIDAIPDVIGMLDKDFRVIRYNAAGYAFLGIQPEDIRGRKCHEVIGRSAPCSICATGEAISSKRTARRETFVAENNIWLDCRSYPILDEKGDILRIIEHKRDITAQKETEHLLSIQHDFALNMHKARELDDVLELSLKTALHIAGAGTGGIYLADEDGSALRLKHQQGFITEGSEAAHRLDRDPGTFFSCNVMEGKPFIIDVQAFKILFNTDRVAVTPADTLIIPLINDAALTGLLFICLEKRESAGKREIDLLETLATVMSSAAARAVTQKKLQQSKERYERFISQSTEGFYVFTLDPPMPVSLPPEEQIDYLYRHMVLEECNSAFLHMYGRDHTNEFPGKTFPEMDIIADPEDDRCVKREFITNNYRIRERITLEKDMYGKKKYFLNNFTGLIKENQLVSIWGTQTDITGQKEAEQALHELLTRQ